MSRKQFTYGEVAQHKSRDDLYVIVHDRVLDLTAFVYEHPGGEEVLVDQGGADATTAFEDVGHSEEARKILETLVIGSLNKKGGPAAAKIAPTQVLNQSKTLDKWPYVVALFGILAILGVYRL